MALLFCIAQWCRNLRCHSRAAWASNVENARPYEDPERKEWFAEECAKLGLDPARTTLFDWLETDERASYAR